jgi:hypothetical protein
MTPQRPSSPTSLLWAHQLKREHGYLLKRMQNLEASNQQQESRVRGAEAAAKAAGVDVATLVEKTKDAIDVPGLSKRMDDMASEWTQKIDSVHADAGAMTTQIEALQKNERVAEEERKQSFTQDKALLKRIIEVEEGLKKYERGLDAIGKRVNGQQVAQIKEQLNGLTDRVNKEGLQMKMLTESIESLEEANQGLRKANAELEEKLRKINLKQARQSREEIEDDPEKTLVPATPDVELSQAKKSHKWSGGGADRDIIQKGADLFGQRLPKAQAAQKGPATAKKTSASTPKDSAKKQPAKRNPVPKAPLTPGEKKSHKWAGGGADRDIINAGLTDTGKRKRIISVSDTPQQPKKKQRKDADGKPIVRSGKGWYEVAESVSPEPDDAR